MPGTLCSLAVATARDTEVVLAAGASALRASTSSAAVLRVRELAARAAVRRLYGALC